MIKNFLKRMEVPPTKFLLLFCVFISLSYVNFGQNIYSGEGVNWVGKNQGYSMPPNLASNDYRVLHYRKVSTTASNPSDGRGQWFTTINAQPSGGDVSNWSLPGGSSNGFLFTSGPSGGQYNNKWNFLNVGQCGLDQINAVLHNSSQDMGIDMSSPGHYTFVLKDVSYTTTGFYVGYTTNPPVTFTLKDQSVNADRSATIKITLSGIPSSQEKFYARYSLTNDFSGGSGTDAVSSAGVISGTDVTLTIPTHATGTTVYYYIFSSTMSSFTTKADRAYSLINYIDNSGSNYSYVTTGGSSTATDYFRSNGSGTWGTAGSWQSSPDGISWITSTVIPDSLTSGITINNGDIIDIGTYNPASVLRINKTIVNGVLKLSNRGFTLFNGVGVDELTINDGGVLLCNINTASSRDYLSLILYGTSGNINVKSGGKISIGDGTDNHKALGYSGFASDPVSKVRWNDGAIFEWNTTYLDIDKGGTYFPGAAAGIIPIFRLTNSKISTSGAGSPTIFNGIVEIDMSYTFPGGGNKVFRDGIRGTGTLIQDGAGAFNLKAGAILDGTLKIVLISPFYFLGNTSIPIDANVTISGANINNAGTLTIIGSLDVTDVSFTPSTSVIINGTLKTSNLNGIKGTGSTFLSSPFTINDGSTIEFYATASQPIETSVNYYNLTLKGGTKTFSSNSSINVSTNGTVSILGPDVLLDATSNNLGPTGANNTKFIMDGGRLILGKPGAQPTMDGIYNITGGVIEFAYKKISQSTLNQTIRPKVYQNIEVSGDSVQNSSGYINLNTDGIFTVKSGGVFVNTDNSIKANGSTTGQKVFVEDGGAIKTDESGGFYGSDGTQSVFSAIHSNILAGNIHLSPNSTVELNGTGDQTNSKDGITFGNLILSGTGQKYFYGVVDVKGNITNTSNFKLNSGTKGFLHLSGTADQTISGSGHFYLHTMEIAKPSGNVLLKNDIDQIDDHLTLTKGKFDIGTGATLNLSDGAGITVGAGDFAAGSLGNIVFKGASLMDGAGTINFYPNIYITPSAPSKNVNFGVRSIVHNLMQLNTNSYVDVNSPSFTSTSLLKYNTGGDYGRRVEWSQASGNGFPYNVQVSGNTVLIPAQENGSFQNTIFNIAGNLTIDDNSSIRMDFGVGPVTGMQIPLIVGGDLLIEGNLYASIQFGGDIKVNKNWTRGIRGKFFPYDRAVFFIGSPNSTITVDADEHREIFPYIILDKDAKSKRLELHDSITITKRFTFSKGTMQLNDADATFQSDLNYTSYLTKLDAANIAINYNGTGRFIVERYMPVTKKAWQLLSVPTKGSTFNASWQEGSTVANSDPKPGYGVGITSNWATADDMKGFDAISTLPSVKYFDIASQDYIGIANTGDDFVESGYFVFVRGDRTVTLPNQPAKPTTLRTRGKIYSPGTEAPPKFILTSGKFRIIGNPYPSVIKFDSIPIANRVNLTNFYYTWDPKLAGKFNTGGFRTLTSDGNLFAPMDPMYPPYPGRIQSGQAFFVQANPGFTGTIQLTEAAKDTGNDLRVFSFAKDAAIEKIAQIRGNIYSTAGGTHELLDGVLTQFSSTHSNDLDADDAEKIPIATESMGIRKGGRIIVIERQAMPLETDTIFYNFKQLRYEDYELQLIADEMETTGMIPYLKDKYLNTDQKLEAGINTINIKIENITGSKAADRFYIYFKAANPTPVTLVSLNAVEKDGNILVIWKVENEKDMLSYSVEVSADGNRFTTGGVVTSRNLNAGSYQWTDVSVSAGYHYYRLKMTGKDGKINYSSIVKVLIGNIGGKSLIAIYPNPIVNNEVRIQLENQPAGLYKARLLNSIGQLIQSMEFIYAGGSSTELLPVRNKLAAGVYHLEISKNGEKVFGEKVICQ